MVELRASLFHALAAQGSATKPQQATATWRDACAASLAEQLEHPDHHYTIAVGDDGQVVGWGHAIVVHQLPGPGFPTGLMRQISSVVTHPDHRGHGIGSAVSHDLLNWLLTKGAEVVDLLASHDAQQLYRQLGFTEPKSTALRYIPTT